MRIAFSLLGLALLSACGGGSEGPSVLENEAREAQTASTLQGWDRMFGAPEETISRANQFGFRAGAYAADGDTYLSKGSAITLSQSDAATPNKGEFEAAGATPQYIDRIAFTLRLTDAKNADVAKQRFVDVLRGFLFQYKLEDKDALDAVLREQSSQGPIAGAPGSIDVVKGDDGTRTITVTFTRTAGTTPVFPDQGQADGNRA